MNDIEKYIFINKEDDSTISKVEKEKIEKTFTKEKQEANAAEQQIKEYIKKVNTNEKNALVPPRVKPGEPIICQACGNPITIKDLNKDPKIAKKEVKWQMHNNCMEYRKYEADKFTRGLLEDRNREINKLNRERRRIEEAKKLKQESKPMNMIDWLNNKS